MGHEVAIATNDNGHGQPFFPLNPTIRLNNIYSPLTLSHLEAPQKPRGAGFGKKLRYRIRKTWWRLRGITAFGINYKKVIHERSLRLKAKQWKRCIDALQPDIIITMEIESLLEMTYGQTYSIPIINSVNWRPDYDYTDILRDRPQCGVKPLPKLSYAHLTGIQILFESYRQFLPDTFSGKTYVIPNAVPQIPDRETVVHTNNKERFAITMIARLYCKGKQQDFAIHSFSLLARKYPQWDLLFWGDGPDKKFLEKLIKKQGLQGRIFLRGTTTYPLEELKKSDIFLFPSRYEGFPLSLTEAMSVGLPSIGFTMCSGVNELIRDGENGFLINDLEECALRLGELMESANLRAKLGKQAHEDMKEYTPEHIFTMWEEALHGQLASRARGHEDSTVPFSPKQ